MSLLHWRDKVGDFLLRISANTQGANKLYSPEASSSSSRLLNNTLFGTLVTQRHHIWQMHFLSVDKLAEFSQKHGLLFFEKKDIPLLWQLGFLRADMVICPRKIHYPGL